MLSEVNAATEAGRVTGQIFVWVALLAGAWKCWSISRRPTTNTKCALSLMIVLLVFVFALGSQPLMKNVATSVATAIVVGFLGLGVVAALISAATLAIWGLVECSQQREVYRQGRAQAIWTLTLAGVIYLIAGAGFIKGLARANGFGFAGGPSQPGKMLVFDDLNFRFRSPDRPWVPFDASRLNKATQLSFTRRNPEAYFMVVAEKFGAQADLTTEQIAEIGRANLQAAAASSQVVSERPWTVNGLNGLLVETEAQVGAYQLHYRHWYLATNGYAYQLVGYSASADRELAAADLADLLSRFELIDSHRWASVAGGIHTNFYSPRHNYTVNMANSDWHLFPGLEKAFPMAEFGLSQGDSCLVVVPANLRGEKIGPEALVAAFLATLDVAYPNESLVQEEAVTAGDFQGRQFDFSREVNNLAYHYRLRVLQGRGEGYLIGAWTQRRAPGIEPVLADAIARVTFLPTNNAFTLLETRGKDEERESKNSGYILNQAGLYYYKQGEFEQALPLFRAAVQANDQQSLYVINALNTWQHLDRPKEALAFTAALPGTLLELPEIRASRALFQAQAALPDEALTNYAGLFATGYRSDPDFTEYIDLLMEQKQNDTALAVIKDYLAAGDSLAAQLLEAQVYRAKKEGAKAITLLKGLREKAPYNNQVAIALAETFIQVGQYTEAREIVQGLLRDNGDSADYDYLKGQSELGLKWYREAKVSFAAAAKLAPANKDILAYLDYVSGLLGEGDNAAVLNPIDPVALPAALTNLPAESVPAGYAKNYGAYYVQRITAAAFERGKQYKKTDFMLLQMLDASGVSAFSTVQVAFDPLAEQVFVNEVRVLDAGGKTISMGNPANYYVLDDRSSATASQSKVLNIPVAGLQPGCRLAVTITRQQLGRMDEFPFCALSFGSTVPIRKSMFFLQGGTNQLNYRTSPAIEPQQLPEGVCWTVTDPMVARVEPLQPPAADFLPMLWIADDAGRWPLIVSNYLGAISDRLEPDADLQNESRQLVARLDNPGAKIELLARYVQTNLTYKAIEFGRRARIPNKPADVLRNKYGDCKDHAVLLQQMLVAAGVPAQLALVSHGGAIKPDLPSLDQFDHMIVYVPDAGEDRFLDCTSKGADVAKSIPVGLAGREALILDLHNPRFVRIPHYPENASSLSVEQHVRLKHQTDLAVEESLTLGGVHAAYLRDYLLTVPEASRRTLLQTILGMSDAELTDLQVDSLDTPGAPLRLRFTYSIKKQFHRSNDELRGVLRAGFARSYLTADPVDNRTTPFEISIPIKVDFTESVEVPTGFRAVPPESLEPKLDPRFETGHASALVEGNLIKLNFQCQIQAGKFEASDYAAYRETLGQALSSVEREVVFQANGN